MLDLRFGEPRFLHPYWEERIFYNTWSSFSPLEYQWAKPAPNLEAAIRQLHTKLPEFKNAPSERLDDYALVVGNGASQVLQAAMHAFGSTASPRKFVHAEPPHFPRFRDFCELSNSGIFFRGYGKFHGDEVELHTLPNNPDGDVSAYLGSDRPKLIDLCYNWPQYLSDTELASQSIATRLSELRAPHVLVYSLAKATGHASTRIGWGFVSDPFLAQRMRDFIEVQSAGVSIEAQTHATRVLQAQLAGPASETVFAYGRKELQARWGILDSILRGKSFVVPNRNGMFLWGIFEEETVDAVDVLRERGLLVLGGRAFGDTPNKFRVNVGASDAEFAQLVQILEQVE